MAQYLGHTVSFNFGKSILLGVAQTEYGLIALLEDDQEELIEDVWLELTPIHKISEEDAIEVAKIMGFRSALSENGKAFVNEAFVTPTAMTFNFHALKAVEAYTLLQARGYDLPNPHLGGRTLGQAECAVFTAK